DAFMQTYWVDLILGAVAPLTIDDRPPPSWIEGVWLWMIQYADLVKLSVYGGIVGGAVLYVYGIAVAANNERISRHVEEARLNLKSSDFTMEGILGIATLATESERSVTRFESFLKYRLRELEFDPSAMRKPGVYKVLHPRGEYIQIVAPNR